MGDKQIELDTDRAAKLMHGLTSRAYELAEERGEVNFRFEVVGVVCICAWLDPNDGEDKEDVAYAFETKKHHVKTGILRDALQAHLARGVDIG